MEEKNKSPIYEEAEKDYIGGMKYKDIAEKYNVSINTVKSWKTRYSWSKDGAKGMHTRNKKVCTQNNKECAEHQEEISWIDIENEYVTDIRKKPCSLEELSKKYNVALQTIFDYSANNNWSNKRRNYKETTKKKVAEKTANIISNDIVKYKLKHLNVSDRILNEIKSALEDETELYKYVEKLRTGYGPGQFNEEITTETLDTINDAKVVNLVNALDKLQKMQRQTLNILDPKEALKEEKENKEIEIDDKPFELPARLIAPAFAPIVFDIEDKLHKEYVLPGGRGSTKSSFFGLEMVNLIKKNPQMHGLAVRKVENTLRDSVYNQIKWAIDALGLNDEFACKLSPLEIEYKPTGQRIYFRGCDDPTKIKSIKPPFGYIGILWFEELDQFAGAEQVRNIEQSAIRGGDEAYIFKSFNPPKTANNWANKYIKIPKENQYQLHSDYRTVPVKWLGKAFIEEAEHLKNVNPTAYEHEYLGIANGNGGNVFDNVEIREITDSEMQNFDRLYFGVDWGYYPDKYAFTKMYYNHNRHELYILDEYCCNKKSNRETYEVLVNEKGITPNDKIVCDSAEPKSIADYRDYGLFARAAIKGPGSVNYKMKWLQSLSKIIIDVKRTPNCATEFLDYEYDRDKEGNVITGYPDKDNHCIDSVSYAMEEVWKRRGQ